MNALGPGWIVCTVLLVAGAWKLLQPSTLWRSLDTFLAARPALRWARRLWRPGSVRALAAAEVAVAALAVGRGGAWYVAVAALYGVFSLSALALARARLSCGCFGTASSVATARHAVVALAAAMVASAAAWARAPGAGSAWSDLPAFGVAHVLLVAAGSGAMIALLTLVAVPERGATSSVTFRLAGDRQA